MTEKITHIKNPLTVIAIFAGLAEVSGTAILPLIAPEIQKTYAWFLMAFPIILVTLFFITLWVKHHVLYAPTDFRSDESFTGLLVAVTDASRFAKLDQEAKEGEAAESISAQPFSEKSTEVRQIARRDFRAAALLAEELVISQLGKELGVRLDRNVAFVTTPDFTHDAVATLAGKTIAIEIKYNKSGVFPRDLAESTVKRLLSVYQSLPSRVKHDFEFIFVVVTDGDASLRREDIRRVLVTATEKCPFKVDIRLFDLASLDSQMSREASRGNTDQQEKLERRIIGILGAGKPLSLREILRDLGIKNDEQERVATVQEAIGTLVINGQIENNSGSIESYQLKKRL